MAEREVADRPRDRLGRPVRQGDPHAFPSFIEPAESLTAADVFRLAADFFDAQLPFHAHELFEWKWRRTSGDEKLMWQALAQFAAAITHVERGNMVGAQRLLDRSSGLLRNLIT